MERLDTKEMTITHNSKCSIDTLLHEDMYNHRSTSLFSVSTGNISLHPGSTRSTSLFSGSTL